MGNIPHYFLAIPIPKRLQDQFSLWQSEINGQVPLKQWYDKRDYHITLKFLGAVEDDKLKRLKEELYIIEQYAAFSIQAGKIGSFGNPKHPRVIWIGVEKTEQLSRLQQTVEKVAAGLGFPKENRPYRPHITLGKRWYGTNKQDVTQTLKRLRSQNKNMFTMDITEVVLFQVEPGKIPKYKPVFTFPLTGI